MPDFKLSTILNSTDQSDDQPTSGPGPSQRPSTWAVERPSGGVAMPGLERHPLPPIMLPHGAIPAPDGRPAAELMHLMPLRASARIQTLNKVFHAMTRSMQAEFSAAGSTGYPPMDRPVPLASLDGAENARITGRAQEPEFNVTLSADVIRDPSDPTAAWRPITRIEVAFQGDAPALAGHFEWVDQPPNASTYGDKIGASENIDAQASARIGVFLIGMTFLHLKNGGGEQIPPEPGESSRLRIQAPAVVGGPRRLTILIGAKTDGSLELQTYDTANRCELYAKFPAANHGAALLNRMPRPARDHLDTLVELIAIALKTMDALKQDQPESTEFPAMDQRLDLASPERSAVQRVAGREPTIDWTVCLSEKTKLDFTDPNRPAGVARPVIGMTVDAHQRNRTLSGHLEWIGEPPGEEFARWVGRLPDADAQASARKALFFLGKALPKLDESSGEAMAPRPDEAGRIKLTLPSPTPGSPAPATVEIGYRNDGGLQLEAHHSGFNRTLAAQFTPGAPQLLKSLPEVFENLQVLSYACALLWQSIADTPLLEGMPGETRHLKHPAFLDVALQQQLREFKSENRAFADLTDAALMESVLGAPQWRSKLQLAMDRFGNELEVHLAPGFIRGGPNPSQAMGITIKSITDGQSLHGHFQWMGQPPMDEDAIQEALLRIGLAFGNLPLATGNESPPLPGERKRMTLALPGPENQPGRRFSAELAVSGDGNTVNAEITEVDGRGRLRVEFSNDSSAAASTQGQLRERHAKSNKMVLDTLANHQGLLTGANTPLTPADEQSLLELKRFTEHLQASDGPSLHELLERKAGGDDALFSEHVGRHWVAQARLAKGAAATPSPGSPTLEQRRAAFIGGIEKAIRLFMTVPVAAGDVDQPEKDLVVPKTAEGQRQLENLEKVLWCMVPQLKDRALHAPSRGAPAPLLDRPLPLRMSASAGAAPVGAAATPDYLVYLCMQSGNDGLAPRIAGLHGEPAAVSMTIDSGTERISSGHFAWTRMPHPRAYADMAGPIDGAEGPASHALALLAKAFAQKRFGRGRNVQPRPDEIGRVMLALPEVAGAPARYVFELGFRKNGGLHLQVRDTDPAGGTLVAAFAPGALRLLKSSP
ncbi:MAG: hypothetical protein ABW032_03260 [Burkholderiaceae bacterium]